MKCPGTPTSYGLRVARGPKVSCGMVLAPVRMSPPTKLGLLAAKSVVVWTDRPTMRSRKPGANRSICAMIASVESPV